MLVVMHEAQLCDSEPGAAAGGREGHKKQALRQAQEGGKTGGAASKRGEPGRKGAATGGGNGFTPHEVASPYIFFRW